MVRYLVRVKEGMQEDVSRSLRMMGFRVVKRFNTYMSVEAPEDVADKILTIQGVVSVEKERTYGISAFIELPVEKQLVKFLRMGGPLNPLAMWYVVKEGMGKDRWPTSDSRVVLGADVAEKMGITGKGITVAVVDTGFDVGCPQKLTIDFQASTIEGDPIWIDNNGHGCIEPDAMVYTTFCGLTTISELYKKVPSPEHFVNGAFVKFLEEPIYTIGFDMNKGCSTITRVLAVHKIPYKGKAVKVVAGTSTFITSLDHPFLVYDRRYGRYKYLRAIDLANVHRNYVLVIPDGNVWLPFEKTVDEDLAYLVGLLISDGYITKKRAIWYSLNKDEVPIVMDYLRKLGYNCSIKSENRYTNGRTVIVYGLIKKLGKLFSNGDRLYIPELLLKQPREVLLALIAGIIDGDGHFDKNRARVRITTTSEKLAYQLVNLLSALGYKSRITAYEPNRQGEQKVYQVSVIGESYIRLVNDLAPYLKLKKPRHFETRNYYPWLWIKKVEVIDYDGYLYDFTTETHNYIAGKIGMTFIHNTHCLTTIAGNPLRTVFGQLEGIAKGVSIGAVKVLGYLIGSGSTLDVMEGIATAIYNGAKVISMSLGSTIGPDERHDPTTCPLCSFIENLADKGYIFCIATGNDGKGYTSCPGLSRGAITVAALDKNLKRADFSSCEHPDYIRYNKPDIGAPGVNIGASTTGLIGAMNWYEGPKVAFISGSSMATPHISGLMALWAEYAQKKGYKLTKDMVMDIFRSYSTWNSETGYGVPKFSWIVDYLK